MGSKLVLVAAVGAVLGGVCARSEAAAVTFSDRGLFNAAAGTVTTEGFETAQNYGTIGQTINAPLSSTTTNKPVFFGQGNVFVPGNLAAGISFSTPSGQLYVSKNDANLPAGFLPGDSTVVLTSGKNTDSLDITLSNANAIGLDFGGYQSGDYTITAYNGANVVSTTTGLNFTNSVGFFGIIADQPITRLNLATSTGFQTIDNVSFGSAPAAAPEPASLGMLVMGAVMLVRRRRH